MDALSLNLLTKATVLTNESREDFQEFVRQHMLLIAPRDAVEQTFVESICNATWRLHRLRAIKRKSADLECQVHACDALAGKNRHFHLFLRQHETRLQNIIRRSLACIRTLRQTGEKKEFAQTAPLAHLRQFGTQTRCNLLILLARMTSGAKM